MGGEILVATMIHDKGLSTAILDNNTKIRKMTKHIYLRTTIAIWHTHTSKNYACYFPVWGQYKT